MRNTLTWSSCNKVLVFSARFTCKWANEAVALAPTTRQAATKANERVRRAFILRRVEENEMRRCVVVMMWWTREQHQRHKRKQNKTNREQTDLTEQTTDSGSNCPNKINWLQKCQNKNIQLTVIARFSPVVTSKYLYRKVPMSKLTCLDSKYLVTESVPSSTVSFKYKPSTNYFCSYAILVKYTTYLSVTMGKTPILGPLIYMGAFLR